MILFINSKSRILQKIIYLQSVLLFIPVTLFAYEFPISSCPVTEDLFNHLSEQIDDRIEGIAANDTSKKLFTTRGNLTSPWVLNPSVWTNNNTDIDFTGMSPWNSRGGYTRAGTLITPRHMALASHDETYTLSNGDTVLFVAPDNSIVTRTVVDRRRIGFTDISIVKLDSDVPETITYYPILDKIDFETYLSNGYDMANRNLPIVVFDQEDKALIKDTTKNDFFYSELFSYIISLVDIDRAGFDELLIGGDSGNAGFVLIGDKPVLVATHRTSSGGPSYSYYREDIQDVIDTMGGEHQLSKIDLSCFNAPIILEENVVLQVAESANEETNIGTIDIKYNVESDVPYFTITSGNDDGALTLSTSTGNITVASSTLITSAVFPRTIAVQVEEDGPGGRASVGDYVVNLSTYPYFNISEYTFSIDEYSATSTVIGTVDANDDENDTLEYSIISGNDSNIFSIDSSTGGIIVANRNLLDYETDSMHTLVVQVQESETVNELTSTITININVNDVDYDFSASSYSFEIDETDTNNTVVGSVSATIADIVDLGELYYQIIAGNTAGAFDIDSSTGAITILDTDQLDGNDFYNLSVGVSNGEGEEVLTSVPVSVEVRNDSRPTVSFVSSSSGLASYTLNEGASFTVEAVVSEVYSKSIVVDFSQTSGSATFGTDYSVSPATLTFAPGETSKIVTISATSDSSNENNETALLNLTDDTRVSLGNRFNIYVTILNVTVSSGGSGGGGGGGSSSKKTDPVDASTEAASTPAVIDSIISLPTALPTTIEGLQALLTSLQAQLAQLLSGTPALSNNPFTRDLELNAEGTEVTQLQQRLISKGYTIPAGATGYFGSQTQQALIKFQQDNNISPAVGYFGVITRKAFVNN